MKKDRFLHYLPPRQLFVSSRGIPAAALYLFGLGILLLAIIMKGRMNPLAVQQKSWFEAFDWHLGVVSFGLCFFAPLIAPTILRHRILLLVLAIAGFILWAVFCAFLYSTIFGSLSQIPKDSPTRLMP